MRKVFGIVSLIALFGAGCGATSGARDSYAPYGSSQDVADVGTPIVPYQADSDLSRIAKKEAAANAPLKDVAKPVGPNSVDTNSMNKTWKFPGKLADAELLGKTVVMETTKGTIEFQVFGDEAPLASSNFLYLTKGGFYDGLTFHRREEGFVIQGGDPIGNGTGGPGYQFADEPVKRSYDRGIVAMANAGPNTNGSQFFIMLGNTPLPPNYTIFGKVTKGMEVVDAIKVGDKMTKVSVK
jgi:cyclophilin family peptidyl-prolyl cis-trans isomerase